MLAKASRVGALLSALVVSTAGCGLPGPWEDRVDVRVALSEDDSIAVTSIQRFQYRENEPADETREHTYELRLVPLDGSDQTVLVPETPGRFVVFHAMRAEGYALVGWQHDGYQLWLDDGRLEAWVGGLVPSPSGRLVAQLRQEPTNLMLRVYDAHTREEIMTTPVPPGTVNDRLRWLDDETLVAREWLFRLGEGAVRMVETTYECDQTPITTSSDVSADGMRVHGRLEGEDVVLDFRPTTTPAWPGPCAALLSATGM